MKKIITAVIFLLGSMGWTVAQSDGIVLKTNFEGEVTFGTIDNLIAKINEGKELRICWQLDFDKDGKSDLEHWIDASFISILNGHVFNQIEPIYRQVPKREIPQIEILNSNMQWTGIIGTNGRLISRTIIPDLNGIEDEVVRDRMIKRSEIREKTVATIWVVKE